MDKTLGYEPRDVKVRILLELQIGKVRAVGLSSAVLKTVGPSGV